MSVSENMAIANMEAARALKKEEQRRAYEALTPAEHLLIFIARLNGGTKGYHLVKKLYPKLDLEQEDTKQKAQFASVSLAQINEAMLKMENHILNNTLENFDDTKKDRALDVGLYWGPLPVPALVKDLFLLRLIPDSASRKAVEIGVSRILSDPSYAWNVERTIVGPKRIRHFRFKMLRDRAQMQHPAVRPLAAFKPDSGVAKPSFGRIQPVYSASSQNDSDILDESAYPKPIEPTPIPSAL